jgi:tRNA 2-selenouridine synthase
VAIAKIDIEKFLELSCHFPVFDVRSPSEFEHAHIPGAYNVPLFSDEERKIVGTTYKQQGREEAIKTGLEFFAPRMRKMVEEAESFLNEKRGAGETEPVDPQKRTILIHCWRGGMRSAGVAWLMDLYGFKIYTLTGGYKQFRNYVLQLFQQSKGLNIVGGYTGSGKTKVLNELQRTGEPVIDLEKIACHKGSAFGAIGQPQQPSQEMFENLLGVELRQKADAAGNGIWIEDESQRIGLVNIPQPFWDTMRRSNGVFLDIPFEKRLNYIVEEYGELDKEKMIHAITRISKRLGSLETKTAIDLLLSDNVRESFRILLSYYDKCYKKGLKNRTELGHLLTIIPCNEVNAMVNVPRFIPDLKPMAV